MNNESYKYQIIGDILLIREINDCAVGSFQEGWELVEKIIKKIGLEKNPSYILFRDNIQSGYRESGFWFELESKGWLFLSTKDPIEAINVTKAKYGL
jgi:hypothetical protein